MSFPSQERTQKLAKQIEMLKEQNTKLDERRKTDTRGFQSSIRLLKEDMKTVVHQMYKVSEDHLLVIMDYLFYDHLSCQGKWTAEIIRDFNSEYEHLLFFLADDGLLRWYHTSGLCSAEWDAGSGYYGSGCTECYRWCQTEGTQGGMWPCPYWRLVGEGGGWDGCRVNLSILQHGYLHRRYGGNKTIL